MQRNLVAAVLVLVQDRRRSCGRTVSPWGRVSGRGLWRDCRQRTRGSPSALSRALDLPGFWLSTRHLGMRYLEKHYLDRCHLDKHHLTERSRVTSCCGWGGWYYPPVRKLRPREVNDLPGHTEDRGRTGTPTQAVGLDTHRVSPLPSVGDAQGHQRGRPIRSSSSAHLPRRLRARTASPDLRAPRRPRAAPLPAGGERPVWRVGVEFPAAAQPLPGHLSLPAPPAPPELPGARP